MCRFAAGLAVGLLLLAGLTFAQEVPRQPVGPKPPPAAEPGVVGGGHVVWQHECVEMMLPTAKRISEEIGPRAKQGWELAAMTDTPTNVLIVCFKRQAVLH